MRERLPLLIPFPEDWRERFENGEILFEEISLVIVTKDLDEARSLAKEAKTKFEMMQGAMGDVEDLRRDITDSIRLGKEADALLGLLFLTSKTKPQPLLYAWVLPLYGPTLGKEIGAMAVLSSSPKKDIMIQELSKKALERVRQS